MPAFTLIVSIHATPKGTPRKRKARHVYTIGSLDQVEDLLDAIEGEARRLECTARVQLTPANIPSPAEIESLILRKMSSAVEMIRSGERKRGRPPVRGE